MKIVVTHRNADFDAMAAQIAASKLHPDAKMVMAGGLPPPVKKFLTIHADYFKLWPVKQVDLDAVSHMVVVDVNSRQRLWDYRGVMDRIDSNEVTFEVYDHHAEVEGTLRGNQTRIEPVGAATTLLVEEIRSAGIVLTPMEATALALGIYSDTGSLTYPGTTPRDATAATFCIEHGASMATLRYFLHQPLGKEQLNIFASLMADVSVVDFNSIKFGITTVSLDKSVIGLSELVNQALMLQGHDAIVAFFVRGDTVNLIGRSRLPAVDIGEIMQRLGGGGHHGAGAAVLKKSTIRQAKIRLMTVLQGDAPTPRFVREVMSTPVFTLSPKQIIADVRDAFAKRRVSGAPVVKDGDIVGVLSIKDVIAAVDGGRGHLPVASCMTQEVSTIQPTRSLLRAFEIMAERGVGRLPVVENDHLIGIITRNDLLNVLYQS